MVNWSGFAKSARGELREIAAFAAVVTLLIGSSLTTWVQSARTDEVLSLRGAGSTFAAPLYKKWIDE